MELPAQAVEYDRCTCDDIHGCPRCFRKARKMIGTTVRDSLGREWKVIGTGEKDGFPIICGDAYWALLSDVEA
jgi:hypothetical protein